jgi:hypothetical protein
MPGVRSVLFLNALGDTVGTFGRAGEGPGEFRVAARSYRIGGERLAVVDPALHRITIIDSVRRLIEVQTIPTPHDPFTLQLARGGWLASQVAHASATDSGIVLRSRSGSSRVDTVALVHTPAPVRVPLGETAINTPPEYSASDSWGLSEDGGIWIARGGDNRVDLYPSDGTMQKGNPVAFARISTTDADRRLWRGMPAPERFQVAARPLAARKAPFQDVKRSANGEFWFWLNQPAGHATEVYACRTATSQELLRVRLPAAHKIVGLSATQVLVYRETADGAVALSGHRRPGCNRTSAHAGV